MPLEGNERRPPAEETFVMVFGIGSVKEEVPWVRRCRRNDRVVRRTPKTVEVDFLRTCSSLRCFFVSHFFACNGRIGRRTAAMTLSPSLRHWTASSRPKPVLAPVMCQTWEVDDIFVYVERGYILDLSCVEKTDRDKSLYTWRCERECVCVY